MGRSKRHYFLEPGETPVYSVKPGTAGPTGSQRAKLVARNQRIVEACKKSNSRVPLEVPIVDASDTMIVLLAHETKVSSALVYVWTKEYQTREERSLDSEGKPLIFEGRTVTQSKVIPNSDYSLVNIAVNCKDETSAVIGVYKYGSDGKVKGTEVVPRQQLSFQASIPGSVGRFISEFSCALR